ncbi:MAG: tRNA lysidine(34) synthetase TilS [Burkholderiales bacterium]|nr:tRNA lysidine(34) synthetase TilS [Burkholderiales bacterium]
MAASPTRPSADDPAAAAETAPRARPRALAVAASGGRDSTALLHCTARAARALGLQVHALHVHHGLQPEADAWTRHLAAQCRRWARAGLPLTLHVRRLQDAPGQGESVEAWARRERYAALAAMAREAGCDTVLLAQHRRDQAETVLLQLLRGAGARGLAAMPAAATRDGIHWLRPWRDQPREAIEAYLARHRLRWVDDASNAGDRHARSRLRAAVWPALDAAFEHAEAALQHAAVRAAEEAACLQALAQIDAADGLDGQGSLRVARWRALPAERRANLLRWLLARWIGRGAPQTLVQRLLAELRDATQGRWPAPAGELRLYRGALGYAPATTTGAHGTAPRAASAPSGAAASAAVDLSRPGCWRVPGWSGQWVVRVVRRGGIAAQRLQDARVAPRHGGERFQRHAGGVPRSLKKQFQAAGVPAWARGAPLLLDAAGALLLVPGLGVDARAVAPARVAQRAVQWRPDADR